MGSGQEIGIRDAQAHAEVGSALEEPPGGAAERILFATDGGDASIRAMDWLAQRAKLRRIAITVLTVIEPDLGAAGALQDAVREAGESILDQATAYLDRTAPAAEVTARLVWGRPRDEFATASAGADLLVAGSDRTGALSGLRGGGFAMKLAEGSTCPVLIVPRTWHAGDGPVVVGVHGDSGDEAALRLAVDEAATLRRQLRVVHAWQLPRFATPVAIADAATALVEAHHSLLADTVDRVRQAHPHLDVRAVLVEGHPATALAREAHGAELLVVGSHHQTVLERFFLGSTGRELIAHPVCPLAVASAAGKSGPAPPAGVHPHSRR